MAIVATLVKQWWDGKKLWAEYTLAFSGNYTSGGDTVNLQGTGLQSSGSPTTVDIHSTSGTAAQAPNLYQWVPGTTQANGLVRAFTGITEVSTGAYPAAITGDTARMLFQLKGFR